MGQNEKAKVPRLIKKRRGIIRNTLKTVSINFFRHNLSKNAASLAYYLLFSLFPLLIFLSNLLGLLNLDVSVITNALNRIWPSDMVALVKNYLDYVSENSSHTLLWFSLIFSVWFPVRAVQGLMDDVRRAYGLKRPKKIFHYMLKQFIYTIIFLGIIIITLLLTLLGGNALGALFDLLPKNLHISDYLLQLWQYLRFLPAGLLMFCAIGILYSTSQDERQPFRNIIPGTLAALLSWLAVCIGFSFYVENFAHYSLIYGTLGTVIVLILWLYLTALLLILGAELNAALKKAREAAAENERKEKESEAENSSTTK